MFAPLRTNKKLLHANQLHFKAEIEENLFLSTPKNIFPLSPCFTFLSAKLQQILTSMGLHVLFFSFESECQNSQTLNETYCFFPLKLAQRSWSCRCWSIFRVFFPPSSFHIQIYCIFQGERRRRCNYQDFNEMIAFFYGG